MSEATNATPWRILFVSMPILIAGGLAVAVGLFFVVTWIGKPATGAWVELRFTSSCGEAWAPVLMARANAVGLGEPSVRQAQGETILRARMPGLDDDLTAIPALLTRPGVFEIYVAEGVDAPPAGAPIATNADVTEVYFQIDATGHPLAYLRLSELAQTRLNDADPPALLYVLDGVVVDAFHSARQFDEDHVELRPRLQTTKEEVRVATDWSIALGSGPAPCAAEGLVVVRAAE